MVKEILLFFVLTTNFIEPIKIPLNKEIEFQIIYESVKSDKIFNLRKYVIEDVDLSSIDETKLIELVSLLSSEENDFSANVILYAYSKRNAASLYGVIGSYLNSNENKDEMISNWRQTLKENDIKYWNEWLKDHNK